jgi:hypothetical protein
VIERRIPEATVARLPVYLQVLLATVDDDGAVATLSSDDLARATGFTAAKVRKDLSFLGSHGTRGVGYPVAELAALISRVLGLTTERPVVLVGAGNLGRALASYEGFLRRGFRLAALVDADPAKVGSEVAGHPVEAAATCRDRRRPRHLDRRARDPGGGRAVGRRRARGRRHHGDPQLRPHPPRRPGRRPGPLRRPVDRAADPVVLRPARSRPRRCRRPG